MTARKLLDALEDAGCRPVADGSDLVFAAEPPSDLTPALAVLHTGVRAGLTGGRWVGLPPGGRAVVLDPRERVPAEMKFLCVLGDATWDRVLGVTRLDLPHLFAADAPADIHKKQTRSRAA